MKIKLEVDTNVADDFIEAIQLLETTYANLYQEVSPDEGGFCGPGDVIEKIETYEDDFEEAVDTGGLVVPEPIAKALETAVETGSPITSTIELDSEGMPWDGRIHTDKKTQKKDGTWKLTRNVDPALVEKVRAEHKQALNAPAVHAASAIPSHEPDAAVAFAIPPAEVPTPPAVSAPVAEVPPAPVETPAAPASVAFPEVLMFCTNKLVGEKGKAFDGELNKILAKYQLKTINSLAVRADLVQPIYAELTKAWESLNTQN